MHDRKFFRPSVTTMWTSFNPFAPGNGFEASGDFFRSLSGYKELKLPTIKAVYRSYTSRSFLYSLKRFLLIVKLFAVVASGRRHVDPRGPNIGQSKYWNYSLFTFFDQSLQLSLLILSYRYLFLSDVEEYWSCTVFLKKSCTLTLH